MEGKASPIVFYGISEDVDLANDLFRRLSFTVYTMSKIRYNGSLRGPGREYSEGFVEGLCTKLDTAKLTDLESNSETRALILKSNEIALRKKTEGKNWLAKEKGIKLYRSTRNFSGMSDPNARAQGRTDGAKLKVRSTKRNKRIE